MERFLDLFRPLDEYVDFYLIQLPPRYRAWDRYRERLERFATKLSLGWRLAVEFRDPGWFNEESVGWASNIGFTFVSVDSPEVIYYCRSGPYIYLRFHGRSGWYTHNYSYNELLEAGRRIAGMGGEAVYAYFNNDHDMLSNARAFREIMSSLVSPSPPRGEGGV
jgi:uncharacterized protein YecE (DUF72 family)